MGRFPNHYHGLNKFTSLTRTQLICSGSRNHLFLASNSNDTDFQPMPGGALER